MHSQIPRPGTSAPQFPTSGQQRVSSPVGSKQQTSPQSSSSGAQPPPELEEVVALVDALEDEALVDALDELVEDELEPEDEVEPDDEVEPLLLVVVPLEEGVDEGPSSPP